MLAALTSLCTSEPADVAAKVLGLGSTQIADVERDARLSEAWTARADTVYSGVLYEALTSRRSMRRRADGRRPGSRWPRGCSGCCGRPTGCRPTGCRVTSLPGLGTVSTYWSKRLDATVREAAGRGLVVDLRSSTATFWRPGPDLARKVVTMRVLHEVNGQRKVVSHFNKATKGRIVRALLEDGAAPGTPARFADHLGALGWKVEQVDNRLDVVVSDL